MGKRLNAAMPRVSLRRLIAAGPQPVDCSVLQRVRMAGQRPEHVAEAPRRAAIRDPLASIRARAKQRQQSAKQAANLSRQDADFLRDIGAL